MANPKIYQVANLQSELSSANNNANNRVLKTGDTMTGNLTFSGTGLRILGDMSNATFSNRLAFQTSTANNNTTVSTLPNGTATTSQYQSYNAADPTNSSLMSVGVGATEVQLQSAIRGTGSYLPMTFYTGGSERMRLDTSGVLSMGTSVAQKMNWYLSGNTKYGIAIAAGDYRNYTPDGNSFTLGHMSTTDGTTYTERFRMDASGNIGVGTSSPATKFHVSAGAIRLDNAFSFTWTGTGGWNGSTTGTQFFKFSDNNQYYDVYDGGHYFRRSGGNNSFVIDATGNVQISASGTEERFLRVGSGRSGNGYSYIDLVGDATYGNGLRLIRLNTGPNAASSIEHRGTGSLQFVTQDAGNMDFYTNGGNLRMRITTVGSVGFGTTNPSTAGRVTIANNMGMVISHETAGVDIRVGFGNVTGNSNSHTGTVLGYRALQNSTPISYSTAIGHDALRDTTTGYNNTAVGYRALPKNTTGIYNTAVGVNALQGNITGLSNIGIGESALYTANTADYNTAVGHQAMYYTTTGFQNCAFGPFSIYNNTTGYYSCAYGVNSLRNNTTGYVNEAFGHGALFNNTTGIENKAFGYQALYYNTTGSYNVCIGSNAMVYNQTSSYNTMVGNYTGYGVTANSTSYYNTAMGYAALYSMRSSTANYNTAISAYALQSLTTGYENIALGYYSGFSITTGIQNTLIGFQSGYYSTSLTTGYQNTFVGAYTRGSSATAINQIVIGYDLAGVGDNYVAIGKAGAYIYNQFTVNSTWTQTSDERLKKNIQNDNLGLSFINRLRPVTYNWKASNELDPTNPLYKTENDRDTATVMHGLIAQEVKAAMVAEGCNTFGGWDEKNGIQSISREQFISPLINAVKELSAKIVLLEAEIKTLKGE